MSAAMSLTCYWIYVYTLNEDLCTVDYKKYYEREKDVFPVLSICLKDPISSNKLNKVNPSINVSSYLKFLTGQVFDEKLLDIDYSSIIHNMTDYIEEDQILYRNGSLVSLHPEYRGDSTYGESVITKQEKRIFVANYSFHSTTDIQRFYACYDLSIPHDRNILEFYFRINSSIFPSGIRPNLGGFMAVLHYPNQLLIAGHRKHQWSQKRMKDDCYQMKIVIQGVEVLKRRQKWGDGCNEDWEEEDSYIQKEYANDLGCTPPYINHIDGVPLCSTKEQMSRKFYFRQDDYGMIPPCREMKSIRARYEETTFDPKEESWAKKGIFWIGINFPQEDFKEISQTR